MPRLAIGLLFSLFVVVPCSVEAVVGQPRTAGEHYDRNPTVVQDGPLTYLFFARSQTPCNRLAGCNPDALDYDLYYKLSPDGGKTYGPEVLLAVNPDGPGPFYGRTIAAIRSVEGASAGTLYVFWASGGNSNNLYVVTKPPAAPFALAAVPVLGTSPLEVFNVEAVAGPNGMFIYTEECCSALGLFAYRFDGAMATTRTPVAPGRSLPKAIVDNQPGALRYRMTYVDASTYPTVDVWVASSADGLVWVGHERVVTEPAVSNWDPNLSQLPNGRYYLYFAPDQEQGAGRQRIAVTTSNDFVRWSAPRDVSPGFTGGTEYWDYWPEGFVLEHKLTLYYTSERGFDDNLTGTAHIWTLPGFSGVNEMPTGSAETSSNGFAPDGWTGVGAATWTDGGSDGAKHLVAAAFGKWISEPIAVEPGAIYAVTADVTGAGGKVVVEQISATGIVLGALAQVLSIVTDGPFTTLHHVVPVSGTASYVRIRLEGGLLGASSFDDIRLWKQ
jgi:hypothetical protein